VKNQLLAASLIAALIAPTGCFAGELYIGPFAPTANKPLVKAQKDADRETREADRQWREHLRKIAANQNESQS